MGKSVCDPGKRTTSFQLALIVLFVCFQQKMKGAQGYMKLLHHAPHLDPPTNSVGATTPIFNSNQINDMTSSFYIDL